MATGQPLAVEQANSALHVHCVMLSGVPSVYATPARCLVERLVERLVGQSVEA